MSRFPKEANWVIFVWCKLLLSYRGKTLDFRIKYMGLSPIRSFSIVSVVSVVLIICGIMVISALNSIHSVL